MLIKLPKNDLATTTGMLPKVEKSIFTRFVETRDDDMAASFRKIFDNEGKAFEDKRTMFLSIMNEVRDRAKKVEEAYGKYYQKRKDMDRAIKALAATESKTGKSIVDIVKTAAKGDTKKLGTQAKSMAKAAKTHTDMVNKAKEGRKALDAEKTMVIEALYALELSMKKFK